VNIDNPGESPALTKFSYILSMLKGWSLCDFISGNYWFFQNMSITPFIPFAACLLIIAIPLFISQHLPLPKTMRIRKSLKSNFNRQRRS
jgi:hypothetical protein